LAHIITSVQDKRKHRKLETFLVTANSKNVFHHPSWCILSQPLSKTRDNFHMRKIFWCFLQCDF